MNYGSNYWLKRSGPRVPRRRLLAGAATLGAGAAALGLVGCGDDDDGTGQPDAAPPVEATTAAPGEAGQPQRGGVHRWPTGTPAWTTFDADRGGSLSVNNVLGLTNQGVVGNYGGGFIPQVEQQVDLLYWNYLKIGEVTNFISANNDWRDVWIDQTDPTWQGRPA